MAQESAHLWVLHGEFVKSCALGNHIDCKLFEQALAPPGFPFIIVLAHLIFGIHSLNASVISAILSSLTIILSFLIAYLVFKKEEVGLYAALVFSLIPLNIINSQTGESRPAGLFFAGLAFLFYILALKNNKLITWLAATVSLSYAIYVRQESYILVPFLVTFFIIYKWPEINLWWKLFFEKKPDTKIILWASLLGWLFFILQIPVLHWLLFNNPYNSYQGGSIGLFSLSFKTIMIPASAFFLQFFNFSSVAGGIWHYDMIPSFIFWATVFLIIFWQRKKEYFLPLVFFTAYYLIYSLLFDGNLYGNNLLTYDYFRRSLMLHLPVAIVAGYGFYYFNPFKKRSLLIFNLLIVFLLIIFLNLNFGYSFISKKTITSFFFDKLNSWQEISSLYFPKSIFKDARATKEGDASLMHPFQAYWSAIEKIPNGCLVISSQNMMVTNDYLKNNERKAVSINLIFDKSGDIFLEEFRENQCVVYIEDYRCRGEKRQKEFSCQFLSDNLEKEAYLFGGIGFSVYKMRVK